jgi:hypothetical protein
MICQCESSLCKHHGTASCLNEGIDQVTPSYKLCPECSVEFRAYVADVLNVDLEKGG